MWRPKPPANARRERSRTHHLHNPSQPLEITLTELHVTSAPVTANQPNTPAIDAAEPLPKPGSPHERAWSVNGQWDLPSGGQQSCPFVANRAARVGDRRFAVRSPACVRIRLWGADLGPGLGLGLRQVREGAFVSARVSSLGRGHGMARTGCRGTSRQASGRLGGPRAAYIWPGRLWRQHPISPMCQAVRRDGTPPQGPCLPGPSSPAKTTARACVTTLRTCADQRSTLHRG